MGGRVPVCTVEFPCASAHMRVLAHMCVTWIRSSLIALPRPPCPPAAPSPCHAGESSCRSFFLVRKGTGSRYIESLEYRALIDLTSLIWDRMMPVVRYGHLSLSTCRYIRVATALLLSLSITTQLLDLVTST